MISATLVSSRLIQLDLYLSLRLLSAYSNTGTAWKKHNLITILRILSSLEDFFTFCPEKAVLEIIIVVSFEEKTDSVSLIPCDEASFSRKAHESQTLYKAGLKGTIS